MNTYNLIDQVQQFLESRLDSRYVSWNEIPYLASILPETQQAAKLLIDTLNKKEKIYFVHDSDADGVGSAAIMNTFFNFLDYSNRVHRITNRKDGYGFLPVHVDEALEAGASLIITTDNGITSKPATDYAVAQGINVIITDHHTVDPITFPDKAIVVDPQTAGDELKDFKDVSGSVVAYFFIEEVARQLNVDRASLQKKISVIEEMGLTTISDVMNLQHMNRLFVKDALNYFNAPRKPYTEIFKSELKYEKTVNAETIGFSLAPTLNAANRFGVADHSYNFLISPDNQTANQYWSYLTHLNEKRKVIVQQYVDLLKGQKIEFDNIIYVNLSSVEKGILGLLANKLASSYSKPAIVTCTYGDKVMGSCRSVGQVNMLEILMNAGIEAGGHKQAFGCSFKYVEIPQVVKHVNDRLKSLPRSQFLDPDHSDFKINFDQITLDLFNMINSYEPFGHGFPKPIFATDATVVKAYRFGKQKNHTKFMLADINGNKQEVVAFFETRNFRPGNKIQINYKLHWDDWGKEVGLRSQQIFLKG